MGLLGQINFCIGAFHLKYLNYKDKFGESRRTRVEIISKVTKTIYNRWTRMKNINIFSPYKKICMVQ